MVSTKAWPKPCLHQEYDELKMVDLAKRRKLPSLEIKSNEKELMSITL